MAKKDESLSKKHTTITIPTTLFELLEDKTKKTGFGSVSAYATYLLRETITKMMQEDAKDAKSRSGEAVKARLRELGYI